MKDLLIVAPIAAITSFLIIWLDSDFVTGFALGFGVMSMISLKTSEANCEE